MQSKGAIKLFAVLLIIASIYQLSFSFITRGVENDAQEYAAQFVETEHAAMEQHYLDSMQNQTVYDLLLVDFTYQECKERELNLGLDLKGGMNVMLTIDVRDLVKALAADELAEDEAFNKALNAANDAVGKGNDVFVNAFATAYKAEGGSLAKAFTTPNRSEINLDSTDEQVIEFLDKQTESAVETSLDILKTRIDRFGVVQPNIQKLSNGRIQVELPGIKEPERVRELLQASASLEFWVCYDIAEISQALYAVDNMTAPVAVEGEEVAPVENKSLLSLVDTQYSYYGVLGAAAESDMELVDEYLSRADVKALLPKDLRFMWSESPIADGRYLLYTLRAIDGKPILDGDAVEDAHADYSREPGRGNKAEVQLIMTADGKAAWSRITGQLAREYEQNKSKFGETGCPLAIVMDKRVYSAPGVKEQIDGGSSVISGDFSIEEAGDLANVLNSGKVPAPARIIQDTVVGPSLGEESINAGLLSFALAFMLVLLYMGLFYKTAGWMSDIALVLNIFLLMGFLVSFGAVLTLPGIAGIVLTMGMAVDANVIIYERIKEELRGGKGLAMAIKDGFSNAYSAIIDGNLTTILTGIVLFVFGNGPVQGFATTLVIGILTSMFCAIFVTRILLEWIVDKWGKLSFSRSWSENWLANVKFDFIGKRKISYVLSGSVILLSVISLCFLGLNQGVDFTGGRTYQIRFDQEVSIDAIRADLDAALKSEDAAKSSVEVKQFGSDNQIRITTQYKYEDTDEQTTKEVDKLMWETLNKYYKSPISLEEFVSTQDNPFGIVSSEKIGPAIAKEMVQNAFLAVFASLLAIGLYITIRFKRWQWATGATLALAHNAFVVIGIFSLLYSIMPFNLEVNQAFIAAILTIIGYSINDTVVIFDRIREYITIYPKRNIRQNINQAICSTLSRTVNTSGTTIVTLLAMFIFGGENLRGFIFALLLGVIIGTYSSVFVATPIAYDILTKGGKKEE